MKKVIVVCLIAMIIAIGCITMAANDPKTPTTEKQKNQITEKQKAEAIAAVAAALKQFSSEVQAILTRENIHSMFDRPRIIKDFGVTYQPELVVANDLTPKLSGCNLNVYAGMKMYDAIYAAVFSKKQEVAKSIQAVDEAMQKLDLRSHADFSGHMRVTVRKIASETENIDIKKMLDQLTTDTLNELPVFMSSNEASHFMADSLYGFMIESMFVNVYFYDAIQNDELKKFLMQPAPRTWMGAVVSVLGAFEKARKDLHIECNSQSLDCIKAIREAISERVTKIRASVLANAK